MPALEQTGIEELAGTRQAVYCFLLAALGPPTPEQHAWLSGPDFRNALSLACEEFGLLCPDGLVVPEDRADHESRYLGCFEVGVPGPPVVLQASHYNHHEPVPRIIHEHILFYRRFGARLTAGNREPADHLVNELAFLIWLDELVRQQVVGIESVLRARLDFLNRQAARWPARAAAEAEDKGLPELYCTLLAVLAAAVQQDQELTESALTGLDREAP
jgi:DMSO reductase family type II enzyme chaperone